MNHPLSSIPLYNMCYHTYGTRPTTGKCHLTFPLSHFLGSQMCDTYQHASLLDSLNLAGLGGVTHPSPGFYSLLTRYDRSTVTLFMHGHRLKSCPATGTYYSIVNYMVHNVRPSGHCFYCKVIGISIVDTLKFSETMTTTTTLHVTLLRRATNLLWD